MPQHSKASVDAGQQHFSAAGRFSRHWLALPMFLVLAAAAALAVDMPIARAFAHWNNVDGLRTCLLYFDMFEMFGNGVGVLAALVVLHQLDRRGRWAIPRVLSCALAAGGLADLLKLIVLRSRPRDYLLDGSVWSTFGSWFGAAMAGSAGQSFPSAHTATAVGFAAALSWRYPQGRLLFSVLAVLVGCQRVISGAHYLSDVLIGAACGCLVGQLFISVGVIPVWFARWEARWKG